MHGHWTHDKTCHHSTPSTRAGHAARHAFCCLVPSPAPTRPSPARPLPAELVELHCFVGHVAGQQQVIPRLDFPCEPHEEQAVDAHHCGRGEAGRGSGRTTAPSTARQPACLLQGDLWRSASSCLLPRPLPCAAGCAGAACCCRTVWLHDTMITVTAATTWHAPPVMFGEMRSGPFCMSASPCEKASRAQQRSLLCGTSVKGACCTPPALTAHASAGTQAGSPPERSPSSPQVPRSASS